MPTRNFISCPICEGTGKLKAPKDKRAPTNRIMAELLKEQGYTIRQIMEFLKYKSPRSVTYLLDKKK